jgi:DNA-binding NarL/FixJ family response regulator
MTFSHRPGQNGARMVGRAVPQRPVGAVLVGGSAARRQGLAQILSAADFHVVESACRVEDLTSSTLQYYKSIFLIIDIGDDLGTAVRQIELFRKHHACAHIAVVAAHSDRRKVVSTLRAGASAYLLRTGSRDAFIRSLELVILGQIIVPSEVAPRLFCGLRGLDHGNDAPAANGNSPTLSGREKSILPCLINGDSNKTIAQKIRISEAAVKVHIKRILRKICVHNRTQAAIWAMNNNACIGKANDGLAAPKATATEASPGSLTATAASPGHDTESDRPAPAGGNGKASHAAWPNFVNLVRRHIRKID